MMKFLATATVLVTLLTATSQMKQNTFRRNPLIPNLLPQNPEPTCTTECDSGTSGGIVRRIVNGEDAVQGENKFIVSLLNAATYEETGSVFESFTCGGALITCKHVLTAAHCHRPCTQLPFVIPGYPCTKDLNITLLVNVGDFNLATGSEAENQIIAVAKYKIHELFVPELFGHDIMILTLATAVTFTPNIGLAYLPSHIVDTDDRIVRAMGWGRTRAATTSAILQQTNLTVVPTLDCANAYPLILKPEAFLRILCTTDVEDKGRGTCYGDSGSPVTFGCEEGHDTVVGLVAYLVQSCGDPNYPSGNTKVDQFIGWIVINTDGMVCLKQCTPKS